MLFKEFTGRNSTEMQLILRVIAHRCGRCCPTVLRNPQRKDVELYSKDTLLLVEHTIITDEPKADAAIAFYNADAVSLRYFSLASSQVEGLSPSFFKTASISVPRSRRRTAHVSRST